MTHIAVGDMAPNFALRTTRGEEITLHDALERGVAVVAFYKASCPVCQMTFPFLERLYRRYGGDGVTFLGISQDDAKTTDAFSARFGITFPVLVDEVDYPVSNGYGLTNVPTIFLVGSDGKTIVSQMGFDKKDLETIAERLAEERVVEKLPLFLATESVPAHKPG